MSVIAEHHREEHVVKDEVKVDKDDANKDKDNVQVKVTRVKLIKANKLIEDEEDEDEEEKYEYAVQVRYPHVGTSRGSLLKKSTCTY